ncbi:MAG: redoxin domain-containing protein [Gammaproteobacteria bacterium]|nr:redoxin domain-containing protein [Gammaproteobacteria bacterium]
MTWLLTVGAPAPDFELPNQHNARVSSADLHGHYALLWWYPKADTPG